MLSRNWLAANSAFRLRSGPFTILPFFNGHVTDQWSVSYPGLRIRFHEEGDVLSYLLTFYPGTRMKCWNVVKIKSISMHVKFLDPWIGRGQKDCNWSIALSEFAVPSSETQWKRSVILREPLFIFSYERISSKRWTLSDSTWISCIPGFGCVQKMAQFLLQFCGFDFLLGSACYFKM